MAVSEDWQTGKSLKDRLFYMLQHQLMCDVTFLVGSEETPLKAHKFMMASASPVFYSMFYGPIAEQGDVKIPDIEAKIFNDILKSVYTDEIEINVNNLGGLLYGAEKYMLDITKKQCNKYMTSHIDHEHACFVFQTAYDFNLEHIKKKALKYIFQTGSLCLNSQTFLALSPKCLELVIESDDLKCKEEEVYLRTKDWAEVKCKEKGLTSSDKDIRSVLGDLLYLIRFPIINRKFFTQSIVKSEILTPDEKIGILCSYEEEPLEIFLSKPRKVEVILSEEFEMWRCELDLKANYYNTFADSKECLDFTTNRVCYMVGVLVFGCKKYNGLEDITLELLQSSEVLNSTKLRLKSVAGREIYPIKFAHASRVMKNTTYTIRLYIPVAPTFWGMNYKTRMLASDLSVTISYSSKTDNVTLSSANPIAGFIFKIEKP